MNKTTKNVRTRTSYDKKFKRDAVKIANEIGVTAASRMLQMPEATLTNWFYKARHAEARPAAKAKKENAAANLLVAAFRNIASAGKVKKKDANEALSILSSEFSK